MCPQAAGKARVALTREGELPDAGEAKLPPLTVGLDGWCSPRWAGKKIGGIYH